MVKTMPPEAAFAFLSASWSITDITGSKGSSCSTACSNKSQTPSIWDTTWGHESSELNLGRGITVCFLARHPVEDGHPGVAKHVTAGVQTNQQTLATNPRQGIRPQTKHLSTIAALFHCCTHKRAPCPQTAPQMS